MMNRIKIILAVVGVLFISVSVSANTIISGITPSASANPTWSGGTEYPINLNNAVDGNYTSVTAGNGGTYAISDQALSDVSYFQFDLGKKFFITSINWKIGYFKFVGTANINIKISEDGTTWTQIYSNSTSSASEILLNESYTSPVSGIRYIRISTFTNGFSEIRIYELQASTLREYASTTVPTVNPAVFNDLKTDTRNFDFPAVMEDSTTPYTAVFGNLFWLFVWLMIFAAYWIRQRSIGFPTVMAAATGGIVIMMLPEQYQLYAKGMIILGAAAMIYILFTKRSD